MTMHVQDRLERLSHEAPRRLGAPADIWRQGRRRQVRQWLAGAGALVVVAVLGGVVAGPLLAPDRVEVASPAAELRLPDVFRQPGAWEPAFDGPPGPLVAVGPGIRGGLLTERNAWWGVSATTGESRFLDLPDAVIGSEADPALSEDGRLLAYWYTGSTSDEPIVQGDADPAVGVAVLDLVTGDVQRWDTGTPHGLMTAGLVWAGEVLWWVGGDYTTGGTDEERDGRSAARLVVHTWEPRSDDRRTREGVGESMYASGSAPGGALVPGGRWLRQLVGDEVARRISIDQDLMFQQSSAPALGPSGLLAGVLDEDPSVFDDVPQPVVVGLPGESGDDVVRLEEVAGVRALAVLGWRRPLELVVLEAGAGATLAEVVDLDTGEAGTLSEFRGNLPDSFASQVWSADVVEAPGAPFAPDHRLVGLALAGAVLLLVRAGLAARRRRDRP